MAAETDAVNMWLYEGVGTFGAPYLSYAPGGGTREVRRFDEDRINGRSQRSFVSSLTRALQCFQKNVHVTDNRNSSGKSSARALFIVLCDTFCAAAVLAA